MRRGHSLRTLLYHHNLHGLVSFSQGLLTHSKETLDASVLLPRTISSLDGVGIMSTNSSIVVTNIVHGPALVSNTIRGVEMMSVLSFKESLCGLLP